MAGTYHIYRSLLLSEPYTTYLPSIQQLPQRLSKPYWNLKGSQGMSLKLSGESRHWAEGCRFYSQSAGPNKKYRSQNDDWKTNKQQRLEEVPISPCHITGHHQRGREHDIFSPALPYFLIILQCLLIVCVGHSWSTVFCIRSVNSSFLVWVKQGWILLGLVIVNWFISVLHKGNSCLRYMFTYHSHHVFQGQKKGAQTLPVFKHCDVICDVTGINQLHGGTFG